HNKSLNSVPTRRSSDLKVKFKMKLNREGQVKSVKIRQGSGRYEVDQQVIAALKGTEIRSKRLASTLWLYKPSSLKDEIEFKLDRSEEHTSELQSRENLV